MKWCRSKRWRSSSKEGGERRLLHSFQAQGYAHNCHYWYWYRYLVQWYSSDRVVAKRMARGPNYVSYRNVELPSGMRHNAWSMIRWDLSSSTRTRTPTLIILKSQYLFKWDRSLDSREAILTAPSFIRGTSIFLVRLIWSRLPGEVLLILQRAPNLPSPPKAKPQRIWCLPRINLGNK